MFNLESLDPYAKEAVACSVAFERMGFSLGAVGAGVDGDGQAFITLHHGGEQYNVVFGKLVDIKPDVYVGTWRDAIRNISDKQVNEVALAELCHRSMIWNKMHETVMQLVDRGFLSV